MAEHPGKSDHGRELSPPANGLIGLLIERFGTAEERRNPPRTFGDAYKILTKYGDGLFGVAAK